MALFAFLLLGGAWFLLPRHGNVAFVAWSALLCMLLVAVCLGQGRAARLAFGARLNALSSRSVERTSRQVGRSEVLVFPARCGEP